MRTLAISISLFSIGIVSYTIYSHNRYFDSNGRLDQYVVLSHCGSEALNLLVRIRVGAPLFPAVACRLRDRHADSIVDNLPFLSSSKLPSAPKRTATELFLISGSSACMSAQENSENALITSDNLRHYVKTNIAVLKWLLENFDHGIYSSLASEVIYTKDVDICSKFHDAVEVFEIETNEI